MKSILKIGIPGVLRYAFLALTAGACLLLLLNLSGYFGITGDGLFRRGEVATHGLHETTPFPLPDGGEFRIYDLQKLVMLDFATAQAFRHGTHLQQEQDLTI